MALLLLSMFLAVQAPDRNSTNQDFPQTSSYFAAKSLLSALVAAGALSAEVVQSSVMILLYEAGHGMHDQARISAALCSQIGMRLLSKRRNQHTATEDGTENEMLWWSIMMLDRYIIPLRSAKRDVQTRSSSMKLIEYQICEP